MIELFYKSLKYEEESIANCEITEITPLEMFRTHSAMSFLRHRTPQRADSAVVTGVLSDSVVVDKSRVISVIRAQMIRTSRSSFAVTRLVFAVVYDFDCLLVIDHS